MVLNRIPVPIKTDEDVVAEQIESAIKGFTYVRRDVGTTVTCKAGPTTMSDEEAVDNLLAVANGIANLPGIGWQNIKVMYARTSHSPSLPLFVADTPSKMPEAKGEAEFKARFEKLQARGEEIAKGADKDEAEEFKKLRKILGDDDFMRIMRDMAEEEEYVKEHPEVLTRPRRRRIVAYSDDEDSEDDEDDEENAVGEVFQQRKDIVSSREKTGAVAEPPSKKQKVAIETAVEEINVDAPLDEETEEEEEDEEKEKEKEVHVTPKTPARSSARSRAVTPKSTVKTRAAARREAELASNITQTAESNKKTTATPSKASTKKAATPRKAAAKK